MSQIIEKYFPDLSDLQKSRFASLYPIYKEWNDKINVISRKDIDNIYVHHVLHSLAIAKFIDFPSGSTVLDVGTGGGFPGIPLAIMFPEASFTLCDSIGKKIKVVDAVKKELQLTNVTTINGRIEDIGGKYDYIVSRAVTELCSLYSWIRNSFYKGVICLKGGETEREKEALVSRFKVNEKKIEIQNVEQWFNEPYFNEKKIIFIEG